MASTNNILQSLIRSNIALLSQKIGLLDVLVSKNNLTLATKQFAKICPYVNASIGQHYRHSLDHIELAALVAQQQHSLAIDNNTSSDVVPELHYDLRVRGGSLESDLQLCRERIVNIVNVFESLQQTTTTTNNNNVDSTSLTNEPIKAYFNLSSTSNKELPLPTTIGRELGFVIHHSIHHMAMCKVIALHTLKLKESELPVGFGRAPSTLLFDKNK